MEQSSSLDVQSYLDARLFLQDYYQQQKNNDPKFSYETWAQKLGLTSKSYLRFVVLGQRKISAELTQKLIHYLGLSEKQSEYFNLLVLYTQSELPEQKKILGRRLVDQLRQNIQTQDIKPSPSLLENPLNLVIRNLLSFSDVPRTTDFLKKILQIDEAQLNSILQNLQTEGLIQPHKEGWEACNKIVKVADQKQQETQLYHRLSLTKAIEAQKFPAHERNFRSIGLAFSENDYTEYLKDLDVFIQNIFAKFDGDHLMNRRLYQINFNLFPWTKTIEVGLIPSQSGP